MGSRSQDWIVVTGSTGGIGAEITSQLVSLGKPVVLTNRSEKKSLEQRVDLLHRYPDAVVEIVRVDLMDTNQIAQACLEINQLPGRVDALYNNAGVLTSERVLSAQGYESQFAVNVLAAYQLTLGLFEKMSRPADESPAVVVNFSSSAIGHPKSLEVGALANPAKVGGLMATYAQTKLATTALAPAMATELGAGNVLIRAIDPGATKTKMTTGPDTSGMPAFISWLAPIFFAPAAKQAAKVISSAAPDAHDGRSGIYIANRREKSLPASIDDQQVQSKLIELLADMLDANQVTRTRTNT